MFDGLNLNINIIYIYIDFTIAGIDLKVRVRRFDCDDPSNINNVGISRESCFV